MKFGLLPRIFVAMAAGVGAGYVLPEAVGRVFATFNGVFSSFLGFIIPLLIVGFVAPAITDIGRRAGKMLLFTVVLAYVATFCAGMFSYGVSTWLFPSMIEPMEYVRDATGSAGLKPYFTMAIEPVMTVMTALVLAFVLGLTVSTMGADSVLRRGLGEFRQVIDMTIRKVVIPLLPLYIFGIFMDMTVSGQVGGILMTFVKIIAVIFAMHVVLLVAQYCIASLFSGKNPFRSLWTMMPAYFTALGTQSSAATIPVTLRQTVKMGVDEDVAAFTVPLCATIHMSGSTLKIVACALALMMAMGHHYDIGMFAGFIAMLGVSIVAAPGVPGGSIMASLGILSSMLGFTDADNALMIALYIAMDSFGTACNVTGDGALAQIVNRFFGKKAVA
ncbi:MAG: dicarboxylate/amino acid:cation symporter [Muribaculaceae bacterium]|nr:dicarboxylate/amino acid:cation symporter [Muribaculaceae bacterium]